MNRDGSYRRKLVADEKVPQALIKRFWDQVIVVCRGKALPGEQPVAALGDLFLYELPKERAPRKEDAPQVVCVEPVLCQRRGSPDSPVGIDDEVCTGEPLDRRTAALAEHPPSARTGGLRGGLRARRARERVDLEDEEDTREVHLQAEPLISGLQLLGLHDLYHLQKELRTQVKVAVLDESFAGLPPGFPPVRFQGLQRPSSLGVVPREPGHGTRMAAVVQEALGKGVELGLYRLVPSEPDDISSWLAAADVAMTLAHAVGEWGADVVLIASGDGLWGTPRYLREVLREARRSGRGGNGAVIVAAVGDASWNHDKGAGTSFAMGVDELAAQPWVIAVGASDVAGQWHRVFDRHGARPTGRFSPSLSLCGSGEQYRIELLNDAAMDDTSGSSALVAAAAAAVLREAPDLDADELRALLQWTADVPPVVDSGAGPGADALNEWDRLGHNPKLGYGRVNALAAVLAAGDPVCAALLLTRPRPACVPLRNAAYSHPKFLLALSWYLWTKSPGLEGPAQELLREYREKVAPALARILLHSWRWRDAMVWLARHVALLRGPEAISPDGQQRHDHGALHHRVEYALDSLREELRSPAFSREAKVVLPWLESLDALLSRTAGSVLHQFLFAPMAAFGFTRTASPPPNLPVSSPRSRHGRSPGS